MFSGIVRLHGSTRHTGWQCFAVLSDYTAAKKKNNRLQWMTYRMAFVDVVALRGVVAVLGVAGTTLAAVRAPLLNTVMLAATVIGGTLRYVCNNRQRRMRDSMEREQCERENLKPPPSGI